MRIIGGIVQPFYLNDVLLSVVADDARGSKRSSCKCRSDTLPSSDEPEKRAYGVYVPPGHLQTTKIVLCQDSPLIQFHRKSYRRS